MQYGTNCLGLVAAQLFRSLFITLHHNKNYIQELNENWVRYSCECLPVSWENEVIQDSLPGAVLNPDILARK